MAGETGQTKLLCKQGGLAVIAKARDQKLIGKLVLIERQYSEVEWVARLLSDPVAAMSEDRGRVISTRLLIARDEALSPLACETLVRLLKNLTLGDPDHLRPETVALPA